MIGMLIGISLLGAAYFITNDCLEDSPRDGVDETDDSSDQNTVTPQTEELMRYSSREILKMTDEEYFNKILKILLEQKGYNRPFYQKSHPSSSGMYVSFWAYGKNDAIVHKTAIISDKLDFKMLSLVDYSDIG